ncbi:MAG: hypothetical protein AB3X44_02900 [Leptothrix sp. (in: b-proteobacteria)]
MNLSLRLRRVALGVLLGSGILSASAAPRVPASDDEIVATLPGRIGPAARQERQWRAQLQQQPGDLGLALQLARRAIERARRDGDPRELGVAQAALTPWWPQTDAPAPVRLLRATIRQSQHAFEPALAELDALLAAPEMRVPLGVRAQAELTRASVLQVLGRLAQASSGCERLAEPRYAALGAGVRWSAQVCLAELASLQGHAAEAVAALAELADAPEARQSDGAAGWLALVRAELAERQGDAHAEQYFQQALRLQPDTYSRAAYADWLLDHDRAGEVLTLIAERDPTQLADALLLRRAIALQRQRDPAAAATIATLQARFDAAHARGDNSHRREEARFLLLRGDTAGALTLARANWAQQREPADARLLHDAALAAGQPDAAEPVWQHLRQYHQSDARLGPPASAGTSTAKLARS